MAERFHTGETSLHENQEIHHPEEKGFREIKPGTKQSLSELDRFWRREWLDTKQENDPYEIKPEDIYGWSEADIPIELDVDDSMRKTLEPFQQDSWKDLDESNKLSCMRELGQSINEKLGLQKVPEIVLVDGQQGDYGAYSAETNRIEINRNYLGDPKELVDTIAHETRHAYQQERADNPQTYTDYLYKENREAYITPIALPFGGYLLFEDYENQYVEADARAFANKVTEAM